MSHFLYITPEDVTVNQFNEIVLKCKEVFSDSIRSGHYGFCVPTYELFMAKDNGYFWIDTRENTYNWGIDNNPQRAEKSSYNEIMDLLTDDGIN